MINWLKENINRFFENPSGYIRLVIVCGLVIFAIYVLDAGYLKGIEQWLFLGMIALLIIYFLDDSHRHYLGK